MIRVLVVDDSALVRKLLRRNLERQPDIEVVAEAADASEARRLMKELDPDVVTLDIEMPGMDGLSFLEKIMQLRPTPVIIISSVTGPGAAATVRAMQLGAVNCYAKSSPNGSLAHDDEGELAQMVREASVAEMPAPTGNRIAKSSGLRTAHSSANASDPSSFRELARPDLIAIGSSTGGVEALHTLLKGFPADCPPTVIVQHINACFAEAIVTSLDRIAKPRVMLAESDLVLKPGEIMIAPGGEKHLQIGIAGRGQWRSVLRPGEPMSGHRPSVDFLFHSVAKHFGDRALGILLTGMGRDGAEGLKAMADGSAHTIAQDKDSCVVFGMPRAAIELGAAKQVLPLDQIAPQIFSKRAVEA